MKQNHNTPASYYLADRRYSFSLDNLLGKGATGNVYKGTLFFIQAMTTNRISPSPSRSLKPAT
jgi:hypothetical protein